jgi:hypothetical protein
MKNIIKPQQREEAEIFSDFSGERFEHDIPEVTLKFSFNYGSKFDDSEITFHLTDKESEGILETIKKRLSQKSKDLMETQLNKVSKDYSDSFDCRDWNGCDYYLASMDLFRYFLDLKEND